jgi:hypothetical protein
LLALFQILDAALISKQSEISPRLQNGLPLPSITSQGRKMKTVESLEILVWSRRGALIGGLFFLVVTGLIEYFLIWSPNVTPGQEALPQYMVDHPFVCLFASTTFGIILGRFLGGNFKDTQLRIRAHRARSQQ